MVDRVGAEEIDTTPPRVKWQSLTPRDLVGARAVNLVVRLDDDSASLTVRWVMRSQYGDLIAQGVATRPPGLCRMRIPATHRNGSPLRAGGYRVQLEVADEAGNRTVSEPKAFFSTRPARARVWRRVPKAGRRVALTFDDGEVGPWRSILATLKKNNIHATFFVIGPVARRAPGLMRRTLAEGHAVGSHSQTHRAFTGLAEAGIARELRLSSAPWRSVDAALSPYVRPPYGDCNKRVVAALGRAGFSQIILWDVDPEDWRRPGAAVIARRVVSKMKPGSIVVLHLESQTAQALPLIVRGLRKRNLQPVSLPEMLRAAK